MSQHPTNQYIPYESTGYFSDFICRYQKQDPELLELYSRFPTLENFKAQIIDKKLSFSQETRKVLSKVLVEQYAKLKTSNLTLDNIAKLKESNAFTITTGHQLNLFTGPLYFLYKIISVINLTKELKTAYPDYNFIPVFWMASEDHDFEEINYFNFRGKKIQWNTEQTGAVGHFNLSGLKEVLEIVVSEFGGGKNAQQLMAWFEDAYLNQNNLADATRYLANELFGTYGLVVIDADHSDLKQLFVPHMEREVFQQTAYNQVSRTNKMLSKLDLKIQVNPREINLFYMKNGLRERIVMEGDTYAVLNTSISWTKAELQKELREFPQYFSPNVIMRPLYQEVILPNLCYIGGGGEMIYWLQLKSNFEAQEVIFPMLLLRNSSLLVTAKQQDKLARLDISEEDLFLDRNSFINQRVRRISNIDIDFSEQIKHLEEQFKNLYRLAEKTEKSFYGAVKAQEVKQIKGLKHLEKRLLKAQKRKLADEINRATELKDTLFPNQNLQERTTNFSEFYLENGEDLIPQLLNTLQPLKGEFTFIVI
jgi:bacillithiol biosynthesis cysteine-adding enzyme BshC